MSVMDILSLFTAVNCVQNRKKGAGPEKVLTLINIKPSGLNQVCREAGIDLDKK